MSKQLLTKYGPFGWSVYYEGGGQLPDALVGYYTSQELALYAIERHKESKPKPKAKRTTNANIEDKHRA